MQQQWWLCFICPSTSCWWRHCSACFLIAGSSVFLVSLPLVSVLCDDGVGDFDVGGKFHDDDGAGAVAGDFLLF